MFREFLKTGISVDPPVSSVLSTWQVLLSPPQQAEKDVAELELWEVVPSGKTEPVLQQLYIIPPLAGKQSLSQVMIE